MNIKIVKEALKVEHQLPEDFHFFRFVCFPDYLPVLYVEFTGARCPLKADGKPDFKKRTEERKFAVTIERGAQIEAQWQLETGKCLECTVMANETAVAEFIREPRYLIYSPYWTRGDQAVWWGPNCRGYVTDTSKAGYYTMAEACAALGKDSPQPVGVALVGRGETLVDCDAISPIQRTITQVDKRLLEVLLHGK